MVESTTLNRKRLVGKIIKGIRTIFALMPDELANFLANQFSGKKQTGLRLPVDIP